MPDAGGWSASPGDVIVSLVPVALSVMKKARQALRESLAAGPTPEILPPVQRKSARVKSRRSEDVADISDARRSSVLGEHLGGAVLLDQQHVVRLELVALLHAW